MFKRISLHDLQRALASTYLFIYTPEWKQTKFHSSTQRIQTFYTIFYFLLFPKFGHFTEVISFKTLPQT